MANIDEYIRQIEQAEYGEEVRSSIVNALKKVNDDNNSYGDIKKEILNAKDAIDDQVVAFDNKVTAAQSIIKNLTDATSTANQAKTNLDASVKTANTAKSNLENATDAAGTAKTGVEQATSNANKAITNANNAKSNLEKVITSAGTAQGTLQDVINAANQMKGQLDTSNSTAVTAKKNLDAAIDEASTAKTQLSEVITNAGKIKTALSEVITQANAAKTNLDNSVKTANQVLQSLDSENTAAASNIEELRSENFNSQEILAGVADLRAYLGLTDDDIVGVQVDYKNKSFKRIAGAINLTKGADFDRFSMFGGRRRCNVADDGTIVAWHGDPDYKEDGTMGQVMVYQPKFYYLVCPVVYDPIETGIGYHLRKANYYVSSKPRAGFRLHPAFYDENGNQVDYILMGAFEGSIYDTSAQAYLLQDEQVADFTASTGDKFSSIAGSKPSSGKTQSLTRPNIEQLAKNRGAGWHLDNIKIASMNQLLMIIEMGQMELQGAIGKGVTEVNDTPNTENNSVLTGGTSSLGNKTGIADGVNGKVSISYRGLENPWGNIWKFIYGVNIWGNGKMDGGQPYICKDFNYSENKNTDNYVGAGFTVANKNGYISAMAYSPTCDWLFMASETDGNSSVPVGDYTYITPNLNGYRIAVLGGYWATWGGAGGFVWVLDGGVGGRGRNVGGRLVYVPHATL